MQRETLISFSRQPFSSRKCWFGQGALCEYCKKAKTSTLILTNVYYAITLTKTKQSKDYITTVLVQILQSQLMLPLKLKKKETSSTQSLNSIKVSYNVRLYNKSVYLNVCMSVSIKRSVSCRKTLNSFSRAIKRYQQGHHCFEDMLHCSPSNKISSTTLLIKGRFNFSLRLTKQRKVYSFNSYPVLRQ